MWRLAAKKSYQAKCLHSISPVLFSTAFYHQAFYLFLTHSFYFPQTDFIKNAQWEAGSSKILRWNWCWVSKCSRSFGGWVWDSSGTCRSANPNLGAPTRPLWAILCRHMGCLLFSHKGMQRKITYMFRLFMKIWEFKAFQSLVFNIQFCAFYINV